MLRARLLVIMSVFLSGCASSFAQNQYPLSSDTVVFSLDLAAGEPPLQATLGQLMSVYKDPGFSVAVIDHNRIAWAKGFGVTAPEGSAPVTEHTLFQAASISKPVTAAGVLWLVQHGRLSLDEDVNHKLKSWQVPDNQFTATQKVTLRRILSHNAGLNVHGFDGYAQGQPLPTTQQTLDGLPPANNPPIRVTAIPGSECNYSGGGYTIAGLLMRDVSGQPFAQFMSTHVLLPAGMQESTFQQDLPPTLAAHAATATDQNGTSVQGKWHLYPELAPDGLWTTPTDLAKFAIEIALSARGKTNHILSRPSVREMLTVQCHDDPTGAGGTGLGFALGYQHHPDIFFHNGSNAGFQSVLMMDPDSGWGYVAMANSDNFQPVNRAVFRTLSDKYGWGVASNTRNLGDDLNIIHALRNTQVALAYYQRAKSSGFSGVRQDVNTLNNFGYTLLGEKKFGDAIRIFQINVAEYPNDGNTYDSLGEAYMDAGERDLAIQNYEKSLQIDPKNDNAVAKLKQLRAK
jgi:CubicO group peptidase (beta-lactamase class C family)